MLRADPIESLRRRTSEKWTTYPADVLPLFVAEMDYPLAPPIIAAVTERITASDSGYVGSPGPLAPAFAGFAARRWGWGVDEAGLRTATDVSVGIVETLRQAIRPGDRVVITPPVYPPFFELVPEAGGIVEQVPLVDDGDSWALDLDGIERALADGARAVLLCNPHNPLGLVHPREHLERLAELAAEHDATIVSDEIHGALVHTDARFTPFLSVSDAARRHGVTITSASKAWNVAGLKCALMVGASDRAVALFERMPEEVGYRASILGLHANAAAFGEGDVWLDDAIAAIEHNRRLLATLLDEHLPGVRYRQPRASYLAWLDFRQADGWGDDPSVRALERGRVALNPGPTFGEQGRGHARLNLACSPEVLTEAIERLTR